MRIPPASFNPLAAALAALAATLVLGLVGPALPGLAALLPWELFGLAVTGGAGFLAWHLAQLTAVPPGPGGRAQAALPAALAPLIVFPHIGSAALAVPLLLALILFRTLRAPALLVVAGAAAAAVGDGPVAAGAVTAALLAAAWRARARCPAANDNPSMERVGPFWPMPISASYAREIQRDSVSGIGE